MNDKLMIISWDCPPSKTGSGVLIDNIFKSTGCIFIGENYKIADKKNHYYIKPFLGNLPRIGKYLKWLSLISSILKIIKIQRKTSCDKILIVFPDEYFLFLGFLTAKIFNIKYSTWFHNTYSHNRKGLLKLLSMLIEPLVVKNAKNNFVLTDALKDLIFRKYKIPNITTIHHGIDTKYVKRAKIKNFLNKKINFVYTGTLNQSVMNSSIRLCKAVIESKNHNLHIFGSNPSYFKSKGIYGDNIIFYPFMNDKEFFDKLSNFDIGLIPLDFDGKLSKFEYKTIFPTRIIPLLHAGLPIIANVPENSFLDIFLKKSKVAEVVNTKSMSDIKNKITFLKYNYNIRKILSQNSAMSSVKFNSSEIVKLFDKYL